MQSHSPFHATTILSVAAQGQIVMAGDGQVTEGNTILKGCARKVRTLFNGKVLAGFAGATADAFTLFERFERQLEKYSGDLTRAAVELAKDWRMDRNLRRLEALLLVADSQKQLILSGVGDVIEPDEGIAAIGSGGTFARSAALALKRHTDLSAVQIAQEAMKIAGQLCIYTNNELVLEALGSPTNREL